MHVPRLHRTYRRVAAWIAILAVVVAALAPTVSRAPDGDRTLAWAEICTEIGTRWVAVTPGTDHRAPQPGSDGTLSIDPCAYCVLQHHAPCLLPARATPAAAAVLQGTERPPEFLRAPRSLPAWASAQPRGPPILF
jgi:hypothetical protein